MQTSAQSAYPTPAPPAGSPTANAASVVITGMTTSDYSFQPRTLKVKAGARVTWAWQSNAPHNVTFSKLGKQSMTGQSETFKLRFKHTGIFHYFCSVHGFTGKIVVHK
jgi:plastocyanin